MFPFCPYFLPLGYRDAINTRLSLTCTGTAAVFFFVPLGYRRQYEVEVESHSLMDLSHIGLQLLQCHPEESAPYIKW